MPENTTLNRLTGDSFYFSFKGQVLSGDFTNFDPGESIDTVDITAGNERARSHISTISDLEFSLDVFVKTITAGTAIPRQLYVGNEGTAIWGNEGTATGKPKYSCIATIINISKPIQFDGAQARSITFKRNGDWIDNFERDGDVW